MKQEGFAGAWATLQQENGQIMVVNSQSLNREQEVVVGIQQGRMQNVTVVKGNITPILPGNPQQRILEAPPLVITLSFEQLVLMQVLGIGQPGWYNSGSGNNNEDLAYILSGDQIVGGNSLNVLLEPETINLTDTNYPGMNDGFPYLWWENDTWLDANFTLGVDTDSIYYKLTADEKALVKAFPMTALAINKNRLLAFAECDSRFGLGGGENDLKDAFRHAYFQAINMGSIFTDKLAVILLAHAHESEVPTHLIKEKQMDLYNNNEGFMLSTIFSTNTAISNVIWQKLVNGQLRYLSPINRSDPFFNQFSDGSVGTHGIGIQTQLIPTNQ
jgi:hypothetical protein